MSENDAPSPGASSNPWPLERRNHRLTDYEWREAATYGRHSSECSVRLIMKQRRRRLHDEWSWACFPASAR